MLNTRNVVAAAVIVTVVSLLGACLAVLASPGGGGLGVDSYGTRGHGLRGLFEILSELHVPAERASVPPSRLLSRKITLALIEPSPEIVSTEPAYLNAIGKWVREGGTVVVSPSPRQWQLLRPNAATKTVLDELGLESVTVRLVRPDSDARENGGDARTGRKLSPDVKRAARNVARLFGRQQAPQSSIVHATAEGMLASVFPQGLDLMLPDHNNCILESDSDTGVGSGDNLKITDTIVSTKHTDGHSVEKMKAGAHKASRTKVARAVAQGRIRAVLEPDGEPETLAAVYAVGDGTIAVLADPRLAENRFVGQADNPVLVSHLLADAQKPVVFDEFYHGLTVRANPLWLLSRFPYDILATSVLAAIVLIGWHAARFLGPPLAPRPRTRRTLSEYIEAMARLLDRSQRPVSFLLTEIRQGLLWSIRHDLGLPPGQDDAEKTVRLLQRRDPALAERTREAIRAIDNSLAHPNPSSKDIETTLAKVSLCVPRHTV